LNHIEPDRTTTVTVTMALAVTVVLKVTLA